MPQCPAETPGWSRAGGFAMSGFYFRSVDPFRVIDYLKQAGCAAADSMCGCIEVALELGFFDRAKQFYCFQQFESDVVQFGVHSWYSGFNPETGEFPPDVCFIEFVGCGGKPPPAELFPPKPLLDWNHNERA